MSILIGSAGLVGIKKIEIDKICIFQQVEYRLHLKTSDGILF